MADFKADGCILTGSLTEAAAGVPFIDAGTNITTAVNANGSITINASGGSSTDDVGWGAPGNLQISTSGSIGASGSVEMAVNQKLYLNGGLQTQFIYGNGNTIYMTSPVSGFLKAGAPIPSQALKWSSSEVDINPAAIAGMDFRVRTLGQPQALFIDASENELHINKGETAFITTISSTNDVAISVGAAGVVFNQDGNASNDFRVESLNCNAALHVDAASDALSVNTDMDVFTTHIYSANGEAISVGAAGVVINEEGDGANDFRVETATEINALLIDSGAETIETRVPLLNLDKPRLSKYITAGTWTGTTSEVDIFSDAEWSVNPTYGSSLTAAYIAHDETNGKFTLTYTSTYCVIVSIIAKGVSNGDFTFRGYVDAVEKFKVAGAYVHAAVDPVERTFNFLVDATAGAILGFTIQASTADVGVAYATVSIHAI